MARSKDSKSGGTIGLVIFGLIFFGIGSAFMWFMALKPMMLSFQADQWPQVACTITQSFVDTSHSSDGSTYKAITTFSYRLQNKIYDGGSYNFSDAYSSGRKGKQKIVNQYKVAQVHDCWVNPAVPTQAVLNKDIPSIVWFVIPFTSIFVLIGGGVLLNACGLFPSLNRSKNTGHTRVDVNPKGYTELQALYGTKRKLFASIVFTLFWNGIVSVFVYQSWQSFVQGDPEWGLTIFISIFVVVGIGLIAWVIHSILALFNPKPSLFTNEGSPRLGQDIQLEWHFTGDTNKIALFTLELEGCEKATYTVGTNTHTDTHVFYKKELLNVTSLSDQLSHYISAAIPAGSMHSFKAGNNEIQWQIKLYGKIPRWPDISYQYPIDVRPLKH